MKSFLIICAFLLFTSAPALAEGDYSSVIDDLPLMADMVEKSDDAIVFDKPGGRIIETTAETRSSPEDVMRFYATTLPPLGWQQHPQATFTRENEMLKITLDSKGRVSVVRFSLTPNEGKQP